MIKKKWIDCLAVTGIILALLFSITLTYFPQVLALEAKETVFPYETELFDKNQVMTVDILMDDDSWNEMLERALEEQYYRCDVVINGVTYYNVGIRPKGNTSLTQIANDTTTDRYSFKLEFDHYDSTQTCMGLDKLVLNNMISDATCRKEYISYDIMSYLGVETSLFSYASVSRNGENWGLYFALEGMEESYATRVFGAAYGELYKPEGTMTRDASGSQGAALAYIDDDLDSYSAIFDGAVFQPSKADKERVVEALKKISEGTEITEAVDVEAMLRYIAANTFLINDDSYFGTMLHNYYLYEQDGILSMLPWDYNLAFGGFQNHSGSEVINRGIDDVVSGSLDERPMIHKLLEISEYQEQYYAYLEELISGYFESGNFEEVMNRLDLLLDNYIKEDPTAFYSYEEYKEANQMLSLFCEKRAESVRSQLDGTLEKTTAAQSSENKIETGGLELSAMGAQGGAGMEGGRGGFLKGMGQLPDGETMPEREERNRTMPEQGKTMPDGMMPPEEGGAPNGMTPPGGDAVQPNDTMQPSLNKTEEQGQSDREKEAGNFQGEWRGGAGFREEPLGEAGSQESMWLWIGISAAVMVAGLLFVRFYPRSRY